LNIFLENCAKKSGDILSTTLRTYRANVVEVYDTVDPVSVYHLGVDEVAIQSSSVCTVFGFTPAATFKPANFGASAMFVYSVIEDSQ